MRFGQDTGGLPSVKRAVVSGLWPPARPAEIAVEIFRLRFLMERSINPNMKTVLPMLAMALMLAGCAHRYDMVLTNGVRVSNVTKPVLNEESGTYTYKDVAGTERHVSQSRVLEIKPHSKRNDSPASNAR
jgi:hypothetical protein